MTNPKKTVPHDPYAKAAATSKPATVEEAIQWQSIAQLHRAEGDLTVAGSLEARAAEALDVGSHVTGRSPLATAMKWPSRLATASPE